MVLANFRDMLQKGAAAPISLRAAQAEVEALSLQRQSKHPVHVFETSLLDCFGLKTLYNGFKRVERDG